MLTLLCEAIRTLRLIAFDYDGLPRVVAPYCHGASANGEALRGVQVRGRSRSGSFGEGKLWMAAGMGAPRLLDERFAPDDPHYNPDDRAMVTIHCRVDPVGRLARARPGAAKRR